MNRTAVTIVIIFAAATVVCFQIYSSTQKYTTVNAGDGRVYRTNRATGETVMIIGAREVPVQPDSPRSETIEDQVIRLAKSSHSLRPQEPFGNESTISSWLEAQTGPLQIHGWTSRKIDDDIFVVTFSFTQGAEVRSWVFEVQTRAQLVRNVTGDAALEVKYGLRSPEST
jgi:hypothetical protein